MLFVVCMQGYRMPTLRLLSSL